MHNAVSSLIACEDTIMCRGGNGLARSVLHVSKVTQRQTRQDKTQEKRSTQDKRQGTRHKTQMTRLRRRVQTRRRMSTELCCESCLHSSSPLYTPPKSRIYPLVFSPSCHSEAIQGKTRQGKTRQDKARQGQARPDKTRLDKARQESIRGHKTRGDKTRAKEKGWWGQRENERESEKET